MKRGAIHTEKAAAPWGPWSMGYRAGDFVFVGGQGPIDHETGKLEGVTIQRQTRITLENMKAILEAAGCSMRDVVKVHVLLTDMEDFAGMNEAYEEYFSPPYPTRMTYGTALTVPGMKVEMDAVAYTGK